MKSESVLILIVFILSLNCVLADCNETQVNLNTASAEELISIIYVGEVTAGNIINLRPFISIDDLLNVSGIGDVKLQAIKDQGLACVGNIVYHISDEEDEGNETIEEEKEFDNEEEIVIRVVSSNIKNNSGKPVKLEPPVIGLDTKDIKIENNKGKLSKKQNYLLLGLFTFTVLIVALISIRTLSKIKQKKNEFR